MSDTDYSGVLPNGSVLRGGRYTVTEVLGAGGFGLTYRATDTVLMIDVAIKEFFPPGAFRVGATVHCTTTGVSDFDTAKDDFLREARALARVNSPHVVHLFDHFDEHNTAYLVMEFLAGQDLATLLSNQRTLPVNQSLGTIQCIANGLEAIHAAGLVHRDIKPSNVIATYDGRVVLVDFGAARNSSSATSLASKALISTGYSPVEQYSAAALTPASDVYAMAATAYHLLTGVGPTPSIDRMVGTGIRPPIDYDPSIPRYVSDAVMAGLSVRREDRPQTAGAFRDLLLGIANSSQTTPTPSTGSRPTEAAAPGPAMSNATTRAEVPRLDVTRLQTQPPSILSSAAPTHRRIRGPVLGGVLVISFGLLAGIGFAVGRNRTSGEASAPTASRVDTTAVMPQATTPDSTAQGSATTIAPQDAGPSEPDTSEITEIPPDVNEPPITILGDTVGRSADSGTTGLNGRPCPTTAGLTDGVDTTESIQIAQFYTDTHHMTICEGPNGFAYFGGPRGYAYPDNGDPPSLTALLRAERVGPDSYVARKGGSTWEINARTLTVTDPHRVAIFEAVRNIDA